ncbi:MAG: PQQ-binding-like beta-propeller repeat protein, partial [Planctomycetaceae bacterium]
MNGVTSSTARIDRRRPLGRMMLLFVALGCCSDLELVSAADWPQWRGPARDAVSVETGLMTDWAETGPETVWHASGLGIGYSSVVVARGRVITIGRHGDDLYCYALSMWNGERLWSAVIGKTSRIPCSTPTVDDDRVYVLDPDGELLCLDWNQGQVIWQVNYSRDFAGQMQSGRGYGESPLVDGDKLICTPGGPEAMLVALNKRSGAVIWKARRPDLGTAGRNGAGFSSIVASQGAGRRQYVQLVGRGLVGVAASDGQVLWGYNEIANGTANIPTPVVRDDFVFSANGYNAGSVLLKLIALPGGAIRAQKVYDLNGSRFQNHHGGVVLIGDYLYGGHGSNNGLPTCLDLRTGRVVWKRRGPGVGSAAVVAADGHLYFRYQNGVVGLLEANPSGYRLKGTLQIPGAGADSWSHPVVANGRLFLREKDDLWVYDLVRNASSTDLKPVVDPSVSTDPALGVLQQERVAIQTLMERDGSHGPTDRILRQNPLLAYAAVGESGPTSQPVLLTLRNAHVTTDGLIRESLMREISRVSRPLVLKLAGTRASDACLVQIAQLKNMVGLDLELCTRVTDAGLKSLSKNSSVRVLILAGTRVTQVGLTDLAALNQLRALDLEVCDSVTDRACPALASLEQLRALVLKKTGCEPSRITGQVLEILS